MRFILAIIITSFVLSCNGQKSNFQSEVKHLFFEADTDFEYEEILKYYRSIPSLKEDTSVGWTSYPPLSALRDEVSDITSHSFDFVRNASLPAIYQSGTLTVEKSSSLKGIKEPLPDLSMYLHFKTKEQAVKAYHEVITQFRKYKPYTDSSLLVIPYGYHMYADTSKRIGIAIQGLFLHNDNSVSISIIRE
jgi:hypothetical protein